MKKILTVLLAMAMVFSIGVSAFAVTDTTGMNHGEYINKLEEDNAVIRKMCKDYDEKNGDPYTFKNAYNVYLGDGLCKTIVCIEIKNKLYRQVQIVDMVDDEILKEYVICNDGLRYSPDDWYELFN